MQILLTQKELESPEGLEIKIEDCIGDTSEDVPGTVLYIEKHEGKIQVHIWNDTPDCTTTIIKEKTE